jgi:hypothetical protein
VSIELLVELFLQARQVPIPLQREIRAANAAEDFSERLDFMKVYRVVAMRTENVHGDNFPQQSVIGLYSLAFPWRVQLNFGFCDCPKSRSASEGCLSGSLTPRPSQGAHPGSVRNTEVRMRTDWRQIFLPLLQYVCERTYRTSRARACVNPFVEKFCEKTVKRFG